MKTIGKYFYVAILILLFISLSGAAQGQRYGDLQAQLSQLESDLQTREQSERIWREAVNTRDVVFLPTHLPIIGEFPAFMDKETFGTMIVIQGALRGLSQEEREELFTEIAGFDEAAREEIRKRYLPELADQIKKDRQQISRIHAQMADLKVPLFNLSGTWYGYYPKIGVDGEPCQIIQEGKSLTFINERGNSSEGSFIDGNTVEAKDWEGGLRGTLTDGGKRINWANGSWWVQ